MIPHQRRSLLDAFTEDPPLTNGGAMPIPGQDDDAVVSFTVKELLRDIKGGIDTLTGKLDAKADRAEVVQLVKVVDEHDDRISRSENRLTVLETQRETEADISNRSVEWWKWVVPTILAVALLVVGVIGLYQAGH